MRFVFDSVRPYRGNFARYFLLSGIGIVLFVGSPYVVAQLINHLVSGHVDSTVWWIVGIFIAMRLVDEWLWRFAEAIIRSFLPDLREAVRTKLFAVALSKQHSFFVNANSGQIAYWVNNATSEVTEVIENFIWWLWPQLGSFIMVMFFLSITNWLMAIVFAAWIIALIFTLAYRGRRQAKLYERTSNALSETSGRVTDALANNLAVRTFAQGPSENTHLAPSQKRVITFWKDSWRYGLMTNAIKGNSAAVVSGIALTLAVYLYSQGNVGLGSIALLVTYITSASETIWALSNQLDTHVRSYGILKDALTNLYATPPERTDGETLHAKSLTLDFKNVSFAYPDQPEQNVLHDFNLTIKNGERVGIVGHSGAGKSTLTSLLLGLYEPTGGQLLWNNTDVRGLSLASLRKHTSYVPQDSQLFNRTIAENIAYGSGKKVSAEAVKKAAQKAQAADFIAKLPHTYDTLVGERGVKLSGGQRQRIAIARAVLSNAPLVVLDEATSALDSVSEQLIQKAFTEVMKGRTAIVIAHRLSTLKHLDRIIVVEAGTIAEQGTHEELLALGGIYADLWRRQKDGFLGE